MRIQRTKVQTDIDTAVVARLPVHWRSLFKLLARSQEKANVWFMEETFSQYGCQPVWHDLFSSLCKQDPHIAGDRLVFNLRFLLLSQRLQEELLQFVIKQAYIIPDADIKQFVLAVIPSVQLGSRVHQLLNELFSCTKYSPDMIRQLDQKSQGAKTLSSPENLKTAEAGLIEDHGSPNSIIILDDSSEEQEPAPKRPRLENQSTIEASEVLRAENQSMDIESLGDVEVGATNGDVGSPNKISGGTVTNNGETSGKKEINDTELSVLEGRGEMVCKLKEIWQSCIMDREVEGLQEVSKLSIKEIDTFCKMINFDSMSDDSIELVCQHLCKLADSLSYNSAVCILTHVLGQRVTELSQNASRKLSGAITLVAQKFQKQIVDCLLVPCLIKSEINSAQSEVVCKTLKDTFTSTSRGYFIQKMLETNFSVSDSNIPVLQTTVDSNCDLTSEVFCKLVHCLNQSTLPLTKNLKYGKLLLALVKKQSKMFNQELKAKFQSILDKYDTFLKKSISAALDKIKV